MPLESATYINGLVVTNPASNDPATQGDDHLRLIKSTLKATFPNINGPVTRTPAEMNYPVLIGTILPWVGDPGLLPAGWALCNGQTVARTDGAGNITTPDLRSRFLRGLPDGGTLGSTGGAASVSTGAAGGHSHGGATATGGSGTLTGSAASAGNHNHTGTTNLAGSHNHTGTTNTAGSHNHGGDTGGGGNHNHGGSTGSTALTVSQIPAHRHQNYVNTETTGTETPANTSRAPTTANIAGDQQSYRMNFSTTEPTVGRSSEVGGGNGHDHSISSSGSHTHAITSDGSHSHTLSIGTDGSHSHNLSIDNGGAHTHSVSVTAPAHSHVIPAEADHTHTVAVLPPFVNVHFIMKV